MYLTNILDSTFITKYKIDHVNLASFFLDASILQVQAVVVSELKHKLIPHTTRTQMRTHCAQARSTPIPKDTRG